MASGNTQLTITLTGRPPVKITKDEWTVIASAQEKEYDNQYEFQANRTANWKLIVRQHIGDGRTIVYGIYTYSSQCQGENDADIRGGELISVEGATPDSVGDSAVIIAAIQRVGSDLEERVLDSGSWSKGYFPRLVHKCIADLPAEVL